MSEVLLYSRRIVQPSRSLPQLQSSNYNRANGPQVFLSFRSYRGTSLIINNPSLGPYSRLMPRALWWSLEGGLFLMSEVPLYM